MNAQSFDLYNGMTDIIVRYSRLKDTDYALVLNGPWGCGKTYYVETSLRSNIEVEGMSLLYVSLSGVKSFSEIEYQILFALWRSSRKFGLLMKILSFFENQFGFREYADGVLLSLLKLNKVKLLKNVSISPSKHFIVIDDVERASEKGVVSDMLSMCYEYLLRDGYKILLIADESKIASDSKYLIYKEKFVRRTITFDVNVRQHIEMFLRSKCPKSFGAGVVDRVCDLCERWQVKNLRTISMLVECAKEIYEAIRTEIQESPAIEEFIVSELFPLICEYSSGELVKHESSADDNVCGLSHFPSAFFYLNANDDNPVPENVKYAVEFVMRYGYESLDAWTCLPSLVHYVVHGTLDMEDIKSDVHNVFGGADSPSALALKRLNLFYTLEEDEIRDVISRIREGLRGGAYEFDQIITIYYNLSLVHKQGYAGDCDGLENLIEEMESAVTVRANSNLFHPSEEELFSMDRGYAEIISGSEIEHGANRIRARIRKVFDAVRDASIGKRLDNLFLALKNRDMGSAARNERSRYENWSLFEQIEKFNRYNDFKMLNAFGLNWFKCQIESNILRIANAGVYSYKDGVPLRKIQAELQSVLKERPDLTCNRKAHIKELYDTIDRACNHIKDSFGPGYENMPDEYKLPLEGRMQ